MLDGPRQRCSAGQSAVERLGTRTRSVRNALLTCDAVAVPVESGAVTRISRTQRGRAGGTCRGTVLVVRGGLIALLGFDGPECGRWIHSRCPGHTGHRPLCRRRNLHNLLRDCRLQVRPGEGFLNGGLGRDRDLRRRRGRNGWRSRCRDLGRGHWRGGWDCWRSLLLGAQASAEYQCAESDDQRARCQATASVGEIACPAPHHKRRDGEQDEKEDAGVAGPGEQRKDRAQQDEGEGHVSDSCGGGLGLVDRGVGGF